MFNSQCSSLKISSRHRIVSMSSPGMTGQQSFQSQVAALYRPVFPDRFDPVLRACWSESTSRHQVRRNSSLVKTDQNNKKIFHQKTTRNFLFALMLV